jgi:DNA-binding transcriptional LysR family regulator
MQRFGGTVSGSIRIGLPPTLCKGVISDVIPAFVQTYPNVQVFLSEGYSSSLSDWVAAKRIDVAVVVQPPEQSGLQAKRIYRDRLILASSPTQGIPPGPIRLEDLADIAVILPSPEASFAGKLIHDWLRATNVAPAQVLEIDGMSSVIELIRNSNWAAVLPSVALARELREGTIQINPFADCSVDLEYFVMHRASLPLSTASQAFVDLLERHLLHMQKEIAANKWRRRKPGRRQSLSA